MSVEAMKQALEWIEAQPEPRMIGATKVITALNQAIERQEQAQNQEPSTGGVIFAVEEAIRNGDCPWQIEQAFDEYEAERKAAQITKENT